jgi:hypothetical protein
MGRPESAVADCAPYAIGDILWVRESFAFPHKFDGHKLKHIPSDARVHYAATESRGGLLWRSSIFMPLWASRITLEITGIRCERLQDINAENARKEGMRSFPPVFTVRQSFASVWEKINGYGAWDKNPWVWVIEFQAVTK